MANDERQELLELYKDLRVADVRDGMDWNMMHHYGSMWPGIRPLWRTNAVGIARTARYLPYEGPIPNMTPEEYTEWSRWYYGNVCTYPWMKEIQPGDFIVIDQSGVTIYNGVLSGVSLDGEMFFYANPLEVIPASFEHRPDLFRIPNVSPRRQEWFWCSCCPTNMARLLASLGQYVASQADGGIYLHLYVGGPVKSAIDGQPVTLTQETRYPWDGNPDH